MAVQSSCDPDNFRANANLVVLYQKTKDTRAQAQQARFEEIKQKRSETSNAYGGPSSAAIPRMRMQYAVLMFATALMAAEGAAELTEATRALYSGDAPRAQSLVEEYRKAHPASAAARLLIARAEMTRGDFHAAYGELVEILQLEPRNLDGLYYLSKLSGILSQIEFRDLYSGVGTSVKNCSGFLCCVSALPPNAMSEAGIEVALHVVC